MIHQFHFWIYIHKNWKQSLNGCLNTQVYRSVIHSSQKMEAAQVSMDRRMVEQNVVYMYSEIWFSLKKEKLWHMLQYEWNLRTLY